MNALNNFQGSLRRIAQNVLATVISQTSTT